MRLFEKISTTAVVGKTLLAAGILILAASAHDFDHVAVASSSSSLVNQGGVVTRRTLFPSLQHQSSVCDLSFSSSMSLTIRGGGTRGGSRRMRKVIVKNSSSGNSWTSGGQSTILSSVFNLVNNVAGAGILTLSAGMATGTGYVTAMIICAVLGWWSGNCFVMVGQACELTSQGDFKGLWKTTMGVDSAWIVDAVISVMCVACAIIYSGILGDVFTPLLAQAGFPSQYNGRTSNS
jgi:hypothetical protein